MKLYLLKAIPGNPHWEPWCDKAFGFVVRANDETDARRIADQEAGDENYISFHTVTHPWLDPACSTCVEIPIDGEAEMILRDFHSA